MRNEFQMICIILCREKERERERKGANEREREGETKFSSLHNASVFAFGNELLCMEQDYNLDGFLL